MGGAGGSDDDVRVHRPFHELFERNRPSVEFLGQVFRPGLVPVGDKHGPDAVLDQVSGRQLAHFAGAENHHRRLRQIAQQFFRQFDRRIAD